MRIFSIFLVVLILLQSIACLKTKKQLQIRSLKVRNRRDAQDDFQEIDWNTIQFKELNQGVQEISLSERAFYQQILECIRICKEKGEFLYQNKNDCLQNTCFIY
jgi:DNA modification methylase